MFNDVVDAMAYGALLFSVVEIYLMLNKLWSRKHIRQVADSISVSSRIIGLIPLSIFSLNYALEHQWQGVLESVMWLFAGIVQLLIGIGIWVAGNRRFGWMSLVKKALRKEREEIGYLANEIFSQHSQHKIIDILTGIALIDNSLEDTEKVYLNKLAEKWHTRIIWGGVKARHKKASISPFYNLWEDLNEYLAGRPSRKELKRLKATVHELVEIDGRPKPEEEIVLHEFDFILDRIEGNSRSVSYYSVTIVPQSIEQDHYLATHFTSLHRSEKEGGLVYTTEPFYSEKYADKVKNQFQSHGYFTTIIIDTK